MPWVETATPASLAINFAALKEQVRLTSSDEDGQLELYARAATSMLERISGRRFITRTFRLDLETFPCHGQPIEIPLPPLSAVSSVQYYSNGALTTWESSNYNVFKTKDMGCVRPKSGVAYPSVDLDLSDAVQVSFSAGYGSTYAAVPTEIQMAILFLAGHFYVTRVPVANGTVVESPNTLKYAVDSFRILSI